VFATSCNRGRRAQNTVATRGLVSTGTGRGGGLDWVVGPWFAGNERVADSGDGPPVHHP
jgi:hypothetical protein